MQAHRRLVLVVHGIKRFSLSICRIWREELRVMVLHELRMLHRALAHANNFGDMRESFALFLIGGSQ